MIVMRPLCDTTLDTAQNAGLPAFVSRLLARRIHGIATADQLQALLSPKLSMLDSYKGLPDIDRASQRITSALSSKEIIALETDHDVDGVSSHAVLKSALCDYFGHPESHVISFIGHRLKEGYGLSDSVADRILAHTPRPSVVITADNGSSDEPRIARLKAEGIHVIVSDHHDMPEEGAPASVFACVSPKASGSQYPDSAIAGVMVSWLLMCAVRSQMIQEGLLSENAPKLSGLLDYVAVGTVADCVSLGSSINNRAVVAAGLQIMNTLERPCWKAMREVLWGDGAFTATDIGFGIGPRINARGRLDEAMAGVHFLLSSTFEEAIELAALLESENTTRKTIEKRLKDEAMAIATSQVAQGRNSLVIWLENGHAGVHGIVASRVVEAFGRPVICLSPKEGHPDLMSGSARAIPGVHVRDAMQYAYDCDNSYFVAFGGHEGAGGLTIKREGLERLMEDYEAAVTEQLEDRLKSGPLEAMIWTDGPVDSTDLNLASLEQLQILQPFGREFEEPVFEGEFTLSQCKPVGKEGIHLKLVLVNDDQVKLQGIWFNAYKPDVEPMPVEQGQRVRAVYSLDRNEFNGSVSLQAVIKTAEVLR
ncbi:DHH family phosphoesterase [Marinobacterium sp. BA1]|uniref:single-stranded-DNA-specific exonuclease RecJ n=1 Tax=Marinobacterium sp. BA1 TaxID=3138931 RepID=UPI0032E5D296